MSKPVIVIVPGAWHKPVVWHDVVQQLHTAGFEAIHVELNCVPLVAQRRPSTV